MADFIFHNGLKKPIDVDKILDFEAKNILGRYYKYNSIDSSQVLEELGPSVIDFSNVSSLWHTLPDVAKESGRLFSIWGEESETNQLVTIIHGFYLLVPFEFSEKVLQDYYHVKETVPYYPIALIHSIRVIDDNQFPAMEILKHAKIALEKNWKQSRERVINHLDKKSKLWQRYILTLDKLITYIFLVPSIDQTLLYALKRMGFFTTGVMQLMSTRTGKYDEATIQNHIVEAKKVFNELKNLEEETS